MRDMQLLPQLAGTDTSTIFLQNFEGTLTILPNRPTLWDYLCVFTDPTYERMARFIRDGQLRTWPALLMIRNRWQIEEKLMEYRKAF